ncbi:MULTISPECIES: methyltransferase domain-containing protein [Burkholderia]|uniref:methyltransferase domain-containing protein n=1 Tax=Burkholderia TaxID=32008 RepID=UPI00158BDEDE|nr:methyltransferase domain-containing protein [Burkholderia ambifaria]MDP9585616.1 protein arginine N-methyltransferase 1 [Burkholderia contaminans]
MTMAHDNYEETGHFPVDIDGRRYHIPNHCPHRAGRLRYGHVDTQRKTITCPLHHSVFCLESGRQIAGVECGALDVGHASINGIDTRETAPSGGAVPVTISPDKDKRMQYVPEQLWTPFSESLLGWDDAFHDLMLNDRLRMKAYRDAIMETVRPGDHVVDLGTGTGILSQWALEAGAARVTGIEMNTEILDLAVRRMNDAGYGARFVPVNQVSYDVELDAHADVLISEIIGNMADNENFQPILEDAIRRFLKPDGSILPLSVSSFLVPVAAPRAHEDLRGGAVSSLTPRYDVAQLYEKKGIRSPFNLYYDCILPRALYLSDPQQLCHYAGKWDQPSSYTRQLRYVLHADGLLTGFKCCFTAALTAGTVLDISGGDVPAGETSDSWKHAYLPIECPIEVQAGDTLNLSFSRRYPDGGETGFQQLYAWRGTVERQGNLVGRFAQDMGE